MENCYTVENNAVIFLFSQLQVSYLSLHAQQFYTFSFFGNNLNFFFAAEGIYKCKYAKCKNPTET
jgi:hypothetical protein